MSELGTAEKKAEPEQTKEQMLDRIKLLSSEITANEEENRDMDAEIALLYAKIDLLDSTARAELIARCVKMICAGEVTKAVKEYRAVTGETPRAARAALGIKAGALAA